MQRYANSTNEKHHIYIILRVYATRTRLMIYWSVPSKMLCVRDCMRVPICSLPSFFLFFSPSLFLSFSLLSSLSVFFSLSSSTQRLEFVRKKMQTQNVYFDYFSCIQTYNSRCDGICKKKGKEKSTHTYYVAHGNRLKCQRDASGVHLFLSCVILEIRMTILLVESFPYQRPYNKEI